VPAAPAIIPAAVAPAATELEFDGQVNALLIQMRRERASKRSGSVLTAARRAGFKILPSTWRAVKRVVAAAHNAASFRELLTGKFADLPQNVKNTICGVVKTVVRGRWAVGWLLFIYLFIFSSPFFVPIGSRQHTWCDHVPRSCCREVYQRSVLRKDAGNSTR
jgi:hypothetical protein